MKGKSYGHIQILELDKFLQSIRSTICLTIESISFFIDNLGSVKVSFLREVFLKASPDSAIDSEDESDKDDEFHFVIIKYDNFI